MEEFEKWLKETKFQEVFCQECGGICEEDLAPAWKAALEMVLKNDDAYCCGDASVDEGWEECPTKTFITKELNDSESKKES